MLYEVVFRDPVHSIRLYYKSVPCVYLEVIIPSKYTCLTGTEYLFIPAGTTSVTLPLYGKYHLPLVTGMTSLQPYRRVLPGRNQSQIANQPTRPFAHPLYT